MALRDRVVLAAIEGVGTGDPRQIDGLGGADSLTSKVAEERAQSTPVHSDFSQFTTGLPRREV